MSTGDGDSGDVDDGVGGGCADSILTFLDRLLKRYICRPLMKLMIKINITAVYVSDASLCKL